MFDNNGEPIQADPFNNLFDDLDGEIFDAMHRDPERFNDIPAQSNFDWSSFGLSNDADLFSVHPTPIATPDATPRASISAASGYTAASASGNETSSSEDEEIGLSPFFEKGGAALKNLVSTERGNWTDGTDDEAELVKFFFSSADETSSSGESGDETNDETDDDDDITDVEDNLPIPVPPSKSKLRRASQPSGTRPQIVDLNDNGPELCSWVADPMRPICVVEGDKQTFLIPKSGVDYMGNDSASEWAAVDDSESEQSMPAFDPAFTGLLNLGDASGLNGLNFEISDAFLNFQEGEGDITDIYSGEDYGLDDYEAGLDIDAFLDISTDEEANREHGISEAEQGDFDDEECTPTAKNQDAFDLWGKVGVTAFRKRQIQHTQKHSALHGTGYNKGKDIPDTITPKKKQKRVRQRFLASNNAAAQKSSKA
ncbi:hypothetical protein BZA77DRAFT_252002 [Pyronema omphalodes]|nr:hypothetical protein BZA77DRAFT_252002 [Pyronema omphalodes]